MKTTILNSNRFQLLYTKPFQTLPLIRSPHVQTLIAALWPRKTLDLRWYQTIIETPDHDYMIAYSASQPQAHCQPDLLLVHGMEGSAQSPYMLGMASKAFQRGFNVHRLNLRGCGASLTYSRIAYHAGKSEDIYTAIKQLQCGSPVFIAGISLGGNLVLKMAAQSPLEDLAGVAGISVPIDLAMGARSIDQAPTGLYRRHFLRALRRSFRRRMVHFPIYQKYRYALRHATTLWDFDQTITAPLHGFDSAQDYYHQGSCIHYLPTLQVPALLIQARDDPFITYSMYQQHRELLLKHPYLIWLDTPHGGHAGFIGRRCLPGDFDQHWAEERVLEFFSLIQETAGPDH